MVTSTNLLDHAGCETTLQLDFWSLQCLLDDKIDLQRKIYFGGITNRDPSYNIYNGRS